MFSDGTDSPADSAKNNGFFGISIPAELDENFFSYSNQLGIKSMVWSPMTYFQNKNLLARKPDIIQTDDPISLLKLTNRFNYESVRP